jgi:hypothetical protein
MHNYRRLILALLCATLPGLVRAEPLHITAPDEAALTTIQGSDWNFGVYFQSDNREIRFQDADVLMEGQHAMARVGYKVLPFLQIYVDGGWYQGQLDEERGSGGSTLAAGASASLAEYVIKASPVLGRQQTFTLLVSGDMSQSQSSVSDRGDLTWHEYRLMPTVRYLRNLEGPDNWHPYQPTGVALQGGPVFTRLDGDVNGESLEGKQDIGFFLGLDMRMGGGWNLNFNSAWYGANDRTLRLGAGFYF